MNRIKDADVLSVEKIFKDKYVIPLYQRNFAWGEEQISRLLQDIYESMNAGDEHFYIGSLIVLQRGNGEYEVIDGQQRLTMLSILSAILDTGIQLSLRYDSRPEVEDFFRALNNGEMPKNKNECAISHFFEAIDLVWSTQLDVEKSVSVTLMSDDVREKMVEYIKHHVCIVREIMPVDTDVAAYFEIMNNRGEQLQEHEIVKGLLLGKLHEEGNDEYSLVCSNIWDACSQMEVRVQKSFKATTRKILFGENYDSFGLIGMSYDNDYGANNKSILNRLISQSKGVESFSLEEIIACRKNMEQVEYTIAKQEESPNEESIIDFPNFLMHIFRLYYNQEYKRCFTNNEEDRDIPLNDKYLLKVYNIIKHEIKPLDFFMRLLYCRMIFDKYLVKSNITDDDEKREWVLLKPYCYLDEKRNASLRYVQTFKESHGEKIQEAVVRAISCLQVSFRAKPYKNFLQTILSWFVSEDPTIVADVYLKKLHGLMLSEFARTSTAYIGVAEFDERHQGTSVPHFLFNFMDYLYWWMKTINYRIDWQDTKPDVVESIKGEMELIRKTDFRFLNRNSIEHHYPQKRQEELESEGVSLFDLNCLGNLVLISKSANSRLSDKNPSDKVALYSERVDLPPTRQIIYNITRENGWGKIQIRTHLECVENILAHRHLILTDI